MPDLKVSVSDSLHSLLQFSLPSPVQVPLLPASGVWLQIPPWRLCFRQVLLPLQMHNHNFFVFLPGKPIQDSARSVPGLLPVAAFSPPDALLGLLSQPFPPLCVLRHLPLHSGYILSLIHI